MSSSPTKDASPAKQATTAEKPFFTEKEERVLKAAWHCLKSPPEIDIEKLRVAADFNTTKTASNTWGTIKKKLASLAPPASVEGEGHGMYTRFFLCLSRVLFRCWLATSCFFLFLLHVIGFCLIYIETAATAATTPKAKSKAPASKKRAKKAAATTGDDDDIEEETPAKKQKTPKTRKVVAARADDDDNSVVQDEPVSEEA